MDELSILSIFKDAIFSHKLLSLILFIAVILYVFIDKFIIQNFIVSIVQGVQNGDDVKKLILYLGIVFIISFCSQTFLDFKTNNVTDSLSSSLITRMSKSIFNKYENDISTMEPQLLTTYFEKLNTVLLDLVLVQKWRKLTMLLLPILFLGVAFYVNINIGMLSLVSLGSIYILGRTLIRSVDTLGLENETNKNKVLDLFSDYINNLISIYSYGTEKTEIEYLKNGSNQLLHMGSKFYSKFANIKLIFIVFTIVILLILLYIILYKFSNISYFSKKSLIILIISVLLEMYQFISISEPINEKINSFNTIALKFKLHKLNTIEPKIDTIHNYNLNIVDLCYKRILNNFNLNVPFGQRLIVSGTIGSGKSTLIKLIMKYIKKCNGNIYLGKNDIDDIVINKYRSVISYIPQNVSLFNRSLEENLFYGSILSDGEKEEIIIQLNIRSFFGNDLKRNIGNNGNKLSGGQRQLLYILRNIIQPFRKIIILDEPTVGLDSEAKSFLISLLNNIQNKTLIIITHDKDIFKIANRIIFIDNGKIIQDN